MLIDQVFVKSVKEDWGKGIVTITFEAALNGDLEAVKANIQQLVGSEIPCELEITPRQMKMTGLS